MFHFGFSYVGLIYLLMLFVPNLIWVRQKPKDYEQYVQKENKVLQILERIGEVLVCCEVLIFSDFNIRTDSLWCIWLLISFLLMLLYEAYWVRYFHSEKTMADMYASLCGFPVAGASLPVCAFLLLGIYGSNLFLLVGTVILGIGHIGIHLQHRNEICGRRRAMPEAAHPGADGRKKAKNLLPRILKGIGGAVGVLLLVVCMVIIGCRNVKYFKHYRLIAHGVDEGIYLTLGGQEQYVLMRGMDNENPLIIYLHGGPSSPDTYITYGFTDYLIDDYTVIAWDQRGCGRTYFHNQKIDAKNEAADFEQAKTDLDKLVDYALERFDKEQVIILGHSYGTILGSVYALEHPDKVSAYIGAAQVTSLEKTDVYSYEDALKKAKAAGDDTAELEEAFEAFRSSDDLVDMMRLRSLTAKYHPQTVSDKATWMAVTSPYFGMDDFRWFLKQLGDMDTYFALNRQLFDYTFEFDAYANGLEYEMPVYLISGTCDWVCPVDTVREYADSISAPEVRMELLEGCGHSPQYSLPKEFAERVEAVLKKEED